jgi:hypothetical protein
VAAAWIDGDSVVRCRRGCWHPRSWRGGIKWKFHLWKLYRGLCHEDIGQLVESSKSYAATGGKWGDWRRDYESVNQYLGCGTGGVGDRGDFEHGDFQGNQENLSTMRFGGSVSDPNFVVALVFSDRAEVPAVGGVGCPGAAYVQSFFRGRRRGYRAGHDHNLPLRCVEYIQNPIPKESSFRDK